jgi:photosystem II stability/assembly factor-like uncharacterized protein
MYNHRFLYVLFCALMAASCSKKEHPLPAQIPTGPAVDTVHWQTINTGFPQAFFNDIWFTDSLHGFAVGTVDSAGYIYSSSDGGLTWQAHAGPYAGKYGQSLVLYFQNASQGYAASASQIAVTTNGGQSWTIKPLTGVAAPMQGNPSIQFTSPDTGYVSIGQGMYKTTDMGTSWTLVNTEPVVALFFTAQDTGYIFYPVYPGDSISQTVNGGISWQPAAASPLAGPIGAPVSSQNHGQLQFTDALHAWSMSGSPEGGTENAVAATDNGGASWHSITPVLTLGDGFMKLRMLSNQTGFVAAANQIMQTNDGGSSWQINYQNYGVGGGGNSPLINSIYFTDANHGWACCADGIILRYRP